MCEKLIKLIKNHIQQTNRLSFENFSINFERDSTILYWYIEPPDFPRNLHVIEKGSRHINLGWTTSQDGNSPITQYIIEYKTESGKSIIVVIKAIEKKSVSTRFNIIEEHFNIKKKSFQNR